MSSPASSIPALDPSARKHRLPPEVRRQQLIDQARVKHPRYRAAVFGVLPVWDFLESY